MKVTAFNDVYSTQVSMGGTILVSSSGGSNSGYSGGDVVGEAGDLSVVRLTSSVSLGSNLTGSVGDVLTLIQTSPTKVAQFATPSNSGAPAAATGSNVAITAVFDGRGTVLAVGSNTMDLEIPFAATIVRSTILADVSTSTVVAVMKDTYGNYPPTIADAITGAAPPTLTTATKAQDTTLSGWTTSVTAGDIVRFSVASNNNATRVTVSLVAARGLP